jgi:aromatase
LGCRHSGLPRKEIDTRNPTPDSHAQMHTGNSILIRAPREKIFETVRDLTNWPKLLPHYRWVRFMEDGNDRRVVKMAAKCAGLPISWTSEYWTDGQLLELHFEHLQHWTKGMKVVWTLTPTRDGTRVEIVHDLKFRVRPLAWLAEPILSGFFIEPVAGRTLSSFKAHFETP